MYIDYKLEFTYRTKKLVEQSHTIRNMFGLEVTFLLNCFGGLVIAVWEFKKDDEQFLATPLDEDFLRYFKSLQLVLDRQLVEINSPERKRQAFQRYTKRDILEKLRNSISRQNINSIADNGQWTGVTMWNEIANKKERDFEVEMDIEKLRSLSLAIADAYINTLT
ncbi:MAG: hypothetical protein LBF81_00525 [Prevotellaceae bacterium]|nr:hypothetical protein [Prevotellaceae bacterium]